MNEISDLIFMYIANVCFDLFLSWEQTRLVYSFLLTKKNRKSARALHRSRTFFEKITLCYVKEYTYYPKAYGFLYRFRLIYIATLIPQYIALIMIHIFAYHIIEKASFVLCLVKIIIICFLELAFFCGKESIFSKYAERPKKR